MQKRIGLLLAIIIHLSLVLGSCSSKAPSKVLNVGTAPHNGLYNDLYAMTTNDTDVCNLIYEGLVTLAPDGVAKVNERIVKDFKSSDDGTKYHFTLKAGITFSDGSPLTAEDVVFTYKTLADPSATAYKKNLANRLKGGPGYMAGRITDFTSVELSGENGVVFNFLKKDRTNMEVCGVKIICEEYYPDWEYGNVDFAMHSRMRSPMGSGPYVLNQVVEGEKLVLLLNPTYWAAEETNYKVDEINIKFYPKDKILDALKEGEIDLIPQIDNREMTIDIRDWDKAQGENAKLDFYTYDSNAYGFIGFNTSIWFSTSSSIRKAVAYGFNRDKFIDEYFDGYASRVNAAMPSSSALYELIAGDLEPYDYDPEKAREILAGVNYVWDDNGVMNFEEKPVTLTFYAIVNNSISEAMLPYLIKDMADLGIDVIIEYYSYSEMYSKLRDSESTWNMYFMEDKWHSDDPYHWAEYFSTTAIPETNVTRYNNPEVNGMMIQGMISENQFSENTLKIYKEILMNLNADIPELPIYTRKFIGVANKKVQGLELDTYQHWSEVVEKLDIAQEEAKK